MHTITVDDNTEILVEGYIIFRKYSDSQNEVNWYAQLEMDDYELKFTRVDYILNEETAEVEKVIHTEDYSPTLREMDMIEQDLYETYGELVTDWGLCEVRVA